MREPDFVDECYADKDLSLLKKLTLVIPTYNRNYYLSRCLWYHAHFPFGEIIVADSSPEEKKVVNRETVAKVREMFGANVRYLEYEPETEKYGGDIYRKWGDAVQHAHTDYCHFCADKDFLIPITVDKCINFMEKNSDYATASGSFSKLTKVERINKNGWISPIYLPRRSQNEDNNIDRVINALNPKEHMNQLLYSTFRSDNLKKICQHIIQKEICDIRYGEHLYTVLGHLHGKYKYYENDLEEIRDVLNREYMASLSNKKKESRKYLNESSNLRYPIIIDYANNPECEMFYPKFKDCLVNEIVTACNIPIKNAETFVDTYVYTSIMKLNKYCGNGGIMKLLPRKKLLQLWKSMPVKVKKILYISNSKIHILNLPLGDVITHSTSYNSISQEAIIIKLIVDTIHLHQKDESILGSCYLE